MSTVKVLLAMAMIIMVAFGAVLAQEKAESAGKASKIVAGGEIIRMASFTATVETIDYVSREAVLKLSDGQKMLVAVGPEAYNFSQVNVGDTVNVDLKESVALAVDQAPSEPGASAATTVVRAPQGQKPEGLAVTTRQATATVEEIDHKERTISLVGPDGNTVFMRVPKDVAPNFDKISKGDTVAIRYTQALAVKVEAAKPKGK